MSNKIYTREEFTKEFSPYINSVTKGTGILPGTALSQGIIESQASVNGKYMVGASKLAREANNYYGIKADKSWKGKVYNIDTGEYTKDGTYYVQKGAGFRSYNSVKDSIADYVKFLQENSRYEKAGVFKAKTVLEQAEALKRAGYATSLNYPATINSVYQGIKNYILIGDMVKKNVGKSIVGGLMIVGAIGLTVYLANK